MFFLIFIKKYFIFLIFILFLLALFVLVLLPKNNPPITKPSPSPTVQPIIIPEQSQSEKQGQADYQYNKATNDFYSSHPWYNKIPPKNNDYFIGYDASTNNFFVELYPKNSSSISIDNQVIQLKKDVIQTLNLIGVNTTFYKIDWLVSPQ